MEVGTPVTYQGTRYATYHGLSGVITRDTGHGDFLLLLDNGAQFLVTAAEVQPMTAPEPDIPSEPPAEAEATPVTQE